MKGFCPCFIMLIENVTEIIFDHGFVKAELRFYHEVRKIK